MKKQFPILLILFLAFALRTVQLTDLPPGLTHDEANHGREALGILDGDLRFYFPLNYGSEPLYSYTVAGSMLALGENRLALRLVNLFFGMGAIALAYGWTRRAFNRETALLAAGITAVSFWPLATSREALRAGMLPFFMTGAIWFFWQMAQQAASDGGNQPQRPQSTQRKKGKSLRALRSLRFKFLPQEKPSWFDVIGFGVCVAITLHIYLAARVAWLIFPLFLGYLLLTDRAVLRRLWRPTLLGLLLAGLLVTPLFVYLQLHPEALTRLDMLDRPLQELRAGNLRPLWENGSEALLAFIWPGYGDTFLAYNIPGRPVLDGITAVFFVIGLLISLWRWRQPTYALILLWFAIGISPSLITGATANTTRNLAALPVVHLLPAVGFMAAISPLAGMKGFGAKGRKRRISQSPLVWVALLWLLWTGWQTTHAYFVAWGQDPVVRDAYQVTLIAALEDLAADPPPGPVIMSTVYPGPAHDASIALVTLPEEPFPLRWVDARYGLLFPQGRAATAVIPAATPPHPFFSQFLKPQETLSMRPDDLNPYFTRYQLSPAGLNLAETAVGANFNDAIHLLDAYWLPETAVAGGVAELVTVWRVADPAQIGPNLPPADAPDTVLFTQILSENGVLAQRDSLEAPSWAWQPGDVVVQIHPIFIPSETAPGQYEAIVGFYSRHDPATRLPVLADNGQITATQTAVPPLPITSGTNN